MSNPFITEKCNAEETAKLVEAGLPLMAGDGKVHWSQVEENAGTDVGYGRGWLVVRWAYLNQYDPSALIDSAKLISDAFKKAEKDGTSGDFNEKSALQAKVIELRDVDQLSWGEIAVRMQIPESRVRAAYRHNGRQKDLGLRIGKGGRFAYGAGELYTENRKREGAQIPHDLTRKPKVEELLNFQPKEGSTTGQAKGQAMGRIWKLRTQFIDGAGRTSEERVAAQAKVASMMQEYGITEQELGAWKKAKDAKANKGRRAA